MEINDIVRENLAAINEDFDALKPFMQKWLIKVETAIQERHSAQESAEATLRDVDYSVKTIAADIDASRTTIYNHEQLLKRYIEYSAGRAASTSPYAVISRLQVEKSMLQEQISKLMLRDVDIEQLKMQNRALATTLEGKNDEIRRLEERILALSEENSRLRTSGQHAGTVSPIPFKKK